MNAVTLVKEEAGERSDQRETRKHKRRKIQLIETPPQPGWTVCVKDERGKWVWYTRLEVTGLLPRRYGPFKSKGQALLFLDDVLDDLTDVLCEGANKAQDGLSKRRYSNRMYSCIHEDELGQAYLKTGSQKRKEG